MNGKRSRDIKRQVKAVAGTAAVTPQILRRAKKQYTNFGLKKSQRPKLKESRRQMRLRTQRAQQKINDQQKQNMESGAGK